MGNPIQRKLRVAGVRLSVSLLLDSLGLWLGIAAAVAAVGIAAERATSTGLLKWWMVPALAGSAVLAAAISWLLTRPNKLALAVEVDQRLSLRTRMSTAVALAGSDNPFAQAALAEVAAKASDIKLRQSFPVRLKPRWLGGLGAAAVATAVFFLMPPLDLLGRQADRDELAHKQLDLAKTKEDVQAAVQKVESAVKNLNNPELAKDLAKLNQLALEPGERPEEVRRQSIKQLGELAEKLARDLDKNKLKGSDELGKMLKNIRGSRGLDDKINQALAKGDFDKASQLLKDIKDKLDDGKLSSEQKEALSQQLADLASQLDKIADQDNSFEKDLEKLGLDKELANLDDQALREALEKQGLTQEQIDELMQQKEACDQACQNAKALAQALGKCSGGQGGQDGQPMSGQDLQELLDQLAQMDDAAEQMAAMEGAMSELENAIAAMGECDGSCNGTCPACKGKAGLAGMSASKNGLAMTTGTPGTEAGVGHIENQRQEDGTSNYTPTLSPTEVKDGQAVASWYFKGPQVKGEATRQYKAAVQAAKDTAAEAISENHIPKRYESAIKGYFGDMESQ